MFERFEGWKCWKFLVSFDSVLSGLLLGKPRPLTAFEYTISEFIFCTKIAFLSSHSSVNCIEKRGCSSGL